MNTIDPRQLQGLTDFNKLLDFLRDRLDWPIAVEDLDTATYDYTADELGINPRYAARITAIKQLRPLVNDQVWGIFFIEFDRRGLPVMALRRILQALAISRRQRDASLPAWRRDDLLFICVSTSAAEGKTGQRGITFAHFRDAADGQTELRTFSWDSRETHFHYLVNLNLAKLRWPRDERDAGAWREQWRDAFTVRHRYVIRTAEKLAGTMAQQAVVIRELIAELYEAEGENGALHQLYHRLQVDLIHDLQPDDFADMIAQTITYGVFSAAVQSREVELAHLAENIPSTNRFLKRMLETLTTQGGLDLDELGVGQLIELLRQVDLAGITRDFGRQTGGGSEDPVIHFYEQFLNEYDRKQRVQRGVFYTPDPVVDYMVRAVDEILQRPVDEGGFGIAEGLASDATGPNGEPLVQILDPATGTGTFLAHIIDLIAKRKNPRGAASEAWDHYVAGNLLKRLNGFELMMAPYTIAHLKLGLKLKQTGYRFGTDERLRVFLTNTLEKPVQLQETLGETEFLSLESNEAAVVKRSKPIMVVIGNPPYAVNSANADVWTTDAVRQDYYPDDEIKENNPKSLLDDYVQFFRFAQERIRTTGEGIIALITNHGYLENPTFRRMRLQLMQEFDEIYVLDLHGNPSKSKYGPDGIRDENVFDITIGVSIGIFVKRTKQTNSGIYHNELWGTRESKYATLLKPSLLLEANWIKLHPQEPFYLFAPQSRETYVEFTQGWRVTDIFPVHGTGLKSRRDTFLIDFDYDVLLSRFEDVATNPSISDLRMRYEVNDTGDWSLARAKAHISTTPVANHIEDITFRPFDNRYIYYRNEIIERGDARWPTMRHMLEGNRDNIGLITTRQVTSLDFQHVFCSRYLVEMKTGSHDRGCDFSPLYEYPEVDDRFDNAEIDWERTNGRRPNLSRAFVAQFAAKLGLAFVTDGRGDLHHTFGPEDIFHYAYAVFHSPTYRTRYAEQLKIDFPRLPLTDDVELFRQLVMRGVDLVALHLLEDGYEGAYWNRHREPSPLSQPLTRFVPGKNGSTVGALSKGRAYDPDSKRIYLDTSNLKDGSYFAFSDAISADEALATWEFQIGGYQVLHKWLYDRRAQGASPGRTLTDEDLRHYQRVVVALYLTRKLMDEIDEVIAEHGGFPLRGSSPEDEGGVGMESDEMSDFPKTPKGLFGNMNDQRSLGDVFDDETDQFDTNGDSGTVAQELTTEVYDETLARTSGVEAEPEDPDLQSVQDIQPFDPAQIRIETRPMSLDVILKRMKHGEINLQPDFQRMGGIWDRLKMSRLIESLLIRIPLPAFYMDATDENQWLVIDGLQRLTSLKRFIIPDKPQDQLRLYKMEFWKEFEGYTFDMLPRHLQRRIEETQVTVYLVEKGTPHNVKFNIFKRINTGGVPLSGQEIRHALNLGTATELLKELADSRAFKAATDNGVSPIRMTDRECVLRFLAFSMRSPNEYSNKDELDLFLNACMKEINELGRSDHAKVDALRQRFYRAMHAAERILGNQAFRKPSKNNRRSPISKALFEVWSVNLEKLTDDQLRTLFDRRKALQTRFVGLMSDIEFDTAISYSTGDSRRVKYRFNMIAQIIEETLNDA